MLMESSTVVGAPAAPLRGRLAAILRDRRAWLLFGTVPIAAGLAWQWSWLTAIGLAPVLLSVAPCLAMCALGLCSAGMLAGGSCKSSSNQIGSSPETTRLAAPNDSPETTIRN
jgi:hypothetical protein